MFDLENLLRDVRTARLYTKDLLGHVDEGDWFRMIAGLGALSSKSPADAEQSRGDARVAC